MALTSAHIDVRDTPTARQRATIHRVVVTPVAFRDPPLLNSVGVHEPFALRSVVEVVLADGTYGLGESYGDRPHLERMRRAAERIVGLDAHDTHGIRRAVVDSLAEDDGVGGHGMSGMVTGSATPDRVFSPFEVAALDLQGKLAGVPVSDLLGGAVRDRVDYSGYLFYKWAAHPAQHSDARGDDRGDREDDWGEALDPAGIVRQARRLVDEYGFTALKLKGGVRPPDEEVAAMRALKEAFGDLPLRLDPNAAWTVETSLRVARELAGVVEYLEDPAPGIDGMAAVARSASMPLATNMAVVAFDHLPEAVAQGAVQVVLSDHHFWGGLRRSQQLAAICRTWGLGLSMHSNSHLGISLAAMTHLAAATPDLDYACDTHWPWKRPDEDVVVDGVLRIEDGALRVPTTPGLGVALDRDRLARLHEQYVACGIQERDDTGYMRRFQPDFDSTIPRW